MASLTETFVIELERRILTGEWQIGERIPPLRSLAEEFHVSRSVINAGIAKLCNDGYLTTLPRSVSVYQIGAKQAHFPCSVA